MKAGAAWHDTCILNISSRGMMMQAADPPVRGSNLEIRRGAQVIVARVMWCNARRFGIESEDILSIDALVSDVASPSSATSAARLDRRAAERSMLATSKRSRFGGRIMDYGFAAALVVSAAIFAARQAYSIASQPVDAVALALG